MNKKNLLMLFAISQVNDSYSKNVIKKESLVKPIDVKKANTHSVLRNDGKVLIKYAIEDEKILFDIIAKNMLTLTNDISASDFRALTFESNNDENKDIVIIKIFASHIILEQSSQIQQNFDIRKDGQNSFMHSSSFSSSSGSSSQVLPIENKKKADIENIDVNFLSDELDNNEVRINSNEFYLIIPLVKIDEKSGKKVIKNIKDVKR